ncbi:MAG: GNAT family N-acetyltransferase [Nanoarchaeota archaeon]|nr:GNAT family N-acetyltransferase [Nanoarchaeota archaeon]
MNILKKIRLMKKSFPETWIRKLPLLIFPMDTIFERGRLAAMCCTVNKRIILLCVDEKFRRQGLASRLIKRSEAVKTDTYLGNDSALKVWTKNGFRVEKVVNSPLGKKYVLRR